MLGLGLSVPEVAALGKGAGAPQLAWCFSRNDLPTNEQTVSSTRFCCSRLAGWTGARAIKNPRFGWVNWYLTSATGAETVGALSPYTVHRIALHWTGQDPIIQTVTATLAAGDTWECDPFPCTIPANTQYWITEVDEYTAAGKRPFQYYYASAKGEGGNYYTSKASADALFDGTFTTNNTQFGVGPAYGYGEQVGGSPLPSVAISGDSIGSYGLYDDALTDGVNGGRTGGDAYSNRGYLRRLLHGLNGYGVIGLGRSNAKAANGYGSDFARRKVILQKASTHLISQLGHNDSLPSGEAAWQATITAMLAEYATYGVPVWHATLLPTSTGSWADAASQTATNATLREAQRAFLTAKVGGVLAGVIDSWAVTSLSGADLGKWRSDGGAWTPDGIHPRAIGAAAIAAALTVPF